MLEAASRWGRSAADFSEGPDTGGSVRVHRVHHRRRRRQARQTREAHAGAHLHSPSPCLQHTRRRDVKRRISSECLSCPIKSNRSTNSDCQSRRSKGGTVWDRVQSSTQQSQLRRPNGNFALRHVAYTYAGALSQNRVFGKSSARDHMCRRLSICAGRLEPGALANARRKTSDRDRDAHFPLLLHRVSAHHPSDDLHPGDHSFVGRLALQGDLLSRGVVVPGSVLNSLRRCYTCFACDELCKL
mmetsp:Transcript_42041/g.104191  ORF Transcript_42041/g.104191 Transcript_42041/m.104191 type:complete len:243 (+) Transcript_42041:480-1208(+)